MLKIMQRICEKTRLDKKTVIVIFVGIIGIVLLVFSELVEQKEEAPKQESDAVPGLEDYAENIETRLEEMISSIHGAGKTKVMVTLDCSEENVYAVEEKNDENSSENKVVIVEYADGENGVLIKVTQPRIRGVAVVCSGGASPTVKQNIMDTVTAVLDISSARVSIATMKTEDKL